MALLLLLLRQYKYYSVVIHGLNYGDSGKSFPLMVQNVRKNKASAAANTGIN